MPLDILFPPLFFSSFWRRWKSGYSGKPEPLCVPVWKVQGSEDDPFWREFQKFLVIIVNTHVAYVKSFICMCMALCVLKDDAWLCSDNRWKLSMPRGDWSRSLDMLFGKIHPAWDNGTNERCKANRTLKRINKLFRSWLLGNLLQDFAVFCVFKD